MFYLIRRSEINCIERVDRKRSARSLVKPPDLEYVARLIERRLIRHTR